MAWLYFPLVFSFTVNPCTAAISACSSFSIGVSLTAFQYSPSTKIQPPRESIGVNAVTVFPINVCAPTFTGNPSAPRPFPLITTTNAAVMSLSRRRQLADDSINGDEHENKHHFWSPEFLKDVFRRRHLDL